MSDKQVKIPAVLHEDMEMLLKEGRWKSKSEIVRAALRDFLDKNLHRQASIAETDPVLLAKQVLMGELSESEG